MPELQKNIEKVLLRLDRMGLQIKQAVADALRAVRDGNVAAGAVVDRGDDEIDREEVEIEAECIRLMARFQPTAVDLRRILMIVKANNDLERIGDKAAAIGRRVKHIVARDIEIRDYPALDHLAELTQHVLEMTVQLINVNDTAAAGEVIAAEDRINETYRRFIEPLLTRCREYTLDIDTFLTVMRLARNLERIGDLCCNIAEDIVYLETGEIVRHGIVRDPAADGDASY